MSHFIGRHIGGEIMALRSPVRREEKSSGQGEARAQ